MKPSLYLAVTVSSFSLASRVPGTVLAGADGLGIGAIFGRSGQHVSNWTSGVSNFGYRLRLAQYRFAPLQVQYLVAANYR